MAKSMSKDSQIILSMMRIQDSINAVLDKADNDNELIKDKANVELLTYYVLKMFAMRKQFSGKTKKTLTIFSDFKGRMISDSLTYCYPMIGDMEIVKVARELSDVVARDELNSRYDVCIKESLKYDGE